MTLTTAEAAQCAGVTVATVRAWCRIGAVATTKAHGQWNIGWASLRHRIALGRLERLRRAERTRVEPLRVVPEIPVAQHASMPDLEIIEAAAEVYADAAEQARIADRTKRASRKVLDQVPDGRWGAWSLEHVDLGRATVDLDAVRLVYARLGLGDVPMKATAPSLKVTRVAVAEVVALRVALTAA